MEGSEGEALASLDWRATSVGIVSVEFTRVNTTKNRLVLAQMRRANFSLVACVREWTGNIYDLVFVRPEHFARAPRAASDGASEGTAELESGGGVAQLPRAAEEWLERHHAAPSHDVLRCKRVPSNETERLSFEITPPRALVQ